MALPRPIVSLRSGIEQEQLWIDFAFPKLKHFETAQYTAEQWREQLVHVAAVTKDLIGDPKSTVWPAEVLATAMATKTYGRAKQLMIAAGHAADEVDKLPVAQVVLWGMISEYRRLRDENFKWYYVPYWQRGAGTQQASDDVRAAEATSIVDPFLNLMTSVEPVSLAEVRTERLVAAHAAIEALRIHAAAHGGKLPAQLADVSLAPVPLDPTTGKHFLYATSGNTGTIKSDAPAGKNPEYFALHFELTIIPRDASSAK